MIVVAGGLVGAACRAAPRADARQYSVTGQVLDVRRDVAEIRLKHEAIPGFMDAMTMSFAVKERSLLDGLARGDLVKGTLVVTDEDAWLSAIAKTGTAPVSDEPEAVAPEPVFALLEPGQTLPDETFVDQDDRLWRPSRLAGRAYALTFIYTRCPLPTYCPLLDRHFRDVQQMLADRMDLRDRVHLVTLSFDPAFDTPEVLRRHARSVGADPGTWTFATGERETVEAFGARLGLTVMRGDERFADITHNLRTAIVSPDGTLVKVYNGSDWTPAAIVADLEAAASR